MKGWRIVRARAHQLSLEVWHFTLRFVLPGVGLATPGPKVYQNSSVTSGDKLLLLRTLDSGAPRVSELCLPCCSNRRQAERAPRATSRKPAGCRVLLHSAAPYRGGVEQHPASTRFARDYEARFATQRPPGAGLRAGARCGQMLVLRWVQTFDAISQTDEGDMG